MKKFILLFLVFSVLALSGNMFAQDESSFTKNFSLSIQSEIYGILGSPTTSSVASYPFYTEKEAYPKLNLALQIPGIRQFFEQNHPSRNAILSLAEGYLKRLAERKKRSRKIWGAVGLIGGGVFLGLGAATISSAEEEDVWGGFWTGIAGTMLVATGAVAIVGGTLSLAIPSGAERELEDVFRISDPVQRERASHEALSFLAARGKKWRILSSVLWASFSVYSLLSKERDYYSTGTFGALAVYELIRKTPAERAFQDYLKEREQQRKLALHLGIGPNGGINIGFSLSY